jgi:hypothetical protein
LFAFARKFAKIGKKVARFFMGLSDRDYQKQNYDRVTGNSPKSTYNQGNKHLGYSRPTKYSTPSILFWVFVVMVGIYWFSNISGVNSKYKVTDAELAKAGYSPSSSASSVPAPITSVLSAVFAIDPHSPPFSIFAPAGGDSYYWKLKDFSTNTVVMTGFVRSGETLKTNIPAGTYYLETAGGTDWQGDVNLFGSYTQIQRTKEPLVFTGYSGHIVSMNKRVDGNLRTGDIPKNRF